MHKDRIQLAVDYDRYREMEAKGILHVLGAWDENRMVGYYIAFIFPHPHYASSGLMAQTDVYYLLPEYRRGNFGVVLFTEAERTLRERGITKAYTSCKIHQDHSKLFESLGWEKSDYVFCKLIE